MNITTIEFTEEQKALHLLLLETIMTRDIGILSGKMGAAILLYLYDKHVEKKVTSNLAGDLLDQVWKGITKITPNTFDFGLCGIGWGTEYLIQSGFVEGEGADICEDINMKIMQEDPRRITDLSLEKGLCGLLHYLLIHIKGCMEQKTKLGFDKMYLHDVYQRINSIPESQIDDELKVLIDQYNKFYTEKTASGYTINLRQFVEQKVEIEAEEESKKDEEGEINTLSTNEATQSILPKEKLSIGLRNNIAYSLINTFIH